VRLYWSKQAQSHLDCIEAYIAPDNPNAAIDTVLTILRLTEGTLKRFPLAGKVGRVAGTRELVLPNLPYTIVYGLASSVVNGVQPAFNVGDKPSLTATKATHQEESLYIVAVLHQSQRWPR
jgi:toxin ParE1/3/4